MILTAILMFAQSGFEPAPLGFLTARDGRVHALYGMRGNFVLSEALEDDVMAAVEMGPAAVKRERAALRIRSGGEWRTAVLPESKVLLAASGGRLMYWVAATGELAVWDGSEWAKRRLDLPGGAFAMAFQNGQLAVLSRTMEGIEHTRFDALTLAPVQQERVEGEEAAIDSGGRLWSAAGTQLQCEGRSWQLESAVVSLQAIQEGWMLIRTRERLLTARCGEPELWFVPEPEP